MVVNLSVQHLPFLGDSREDASLDQLLLVGLQLLLQFGQGVSPKDVQNPCLIVGLILWHVVLEGVGDDELEVIEDALESALVVGPFEATFIHLAETHGSLDDVHVV